MRYLTVEKEARVARSQSVSCEKSLCILCQKIGGQLHKFDLKEIGQKMLFSRKNCQIIECINN